MRLRDPAFWQNDSDSERGADEFVSEVEEESAVDQEAHKELILKAKKTVGLGVSDLEIYLRSQK